MLFAVNPWEVVTSSRWYCKIKNHTFRVQPKSSASTKRTRRSITWMKLVMMRASSLKLSLTKTSKTTISSSINKWGPRLANPYNLLTTEKPSTLAMAVRPSWLEQQVRATTNKESKGRSQETSMRLTVWYLGKPYRSLMWMLRLRLMRSDHCSKLREPDLKKRIRTDSKLKKLTKEEWRDPSCPNRTQKPITSVKAWMSQEDVRNGAVTN